MPHCRMKVATRGVKVVRLVVATELQTRDRAPSWYGDATEPNSSQETVAKPQTDDVHVEGSKRRRKENENSSSPRRALPSAET